ncbi:MAG: hypothetical protein PHG67_05510 [Bacteroidales bacterium]|jgi:hypothetical protein|nr:hypothetical protein [Bacteroidales bacterium]
MSYIITRIAPFLRDENTLTFLGKEKVKQNEKHQFQFKLFDGDGIEYFTGISSSKWDFRPLDEFGLAFGCTEIKYLEGDIYIIC